MSNRMEEILRASVRIVTGLPHAEARPGQALLAAELTKAIDGYGQTCGIAPTGIGKSLAALAPAMAAFVESGERTIISTDALSLMDQIVDKDAPVVAEATRQVTGRTPVVASLKGFSNYVCLSKAHQVTDLVTNGAAAGGLPSKRATLAGVLKSTPVDVGFGELPANQLASMAEWALSEQQNQGVGDIHTYPGEAPAGSWRTMTVSPARCAGSDCPFFEDCFPVKARAVAGAADVVVTNHSMLAVQAATGTPVVLGNKTLGAFRHVIVDEAHTLPEKVRDQGAAQLSAASFHAASRKAADVLKERRPADAARILQEGKFLGQYFEDQIEDFAKGLRTTETRKLTKEDRPLADGHVTIADWVKKTVGTVVGFQSTPLVGAAAIDALENLGSATKALSDFRSVQARWVEATDMGPVLSGSPIDVGPLIAKNLWTVAVEPDEELALERAALKAAGEELEELPREPVGAICISATLPPGFPRQAGMECGVDEYDSPFREAYDKCMLYLPSDESINGLSPFVLRNGRWVFDVMSHRAWVAKLAPRLFEENQGAGMMLSATKDGGLAYVEALRRSGRGRWKVYSQWEGVSPKRLVAQWRDDESGVLVGTKALMTGVDAKGRSNSLVLLDRFPRNAPNPVDEATVDEMVERGFDRQVAIRQVYAVKATLLTAQAMGRLVRSVNDRGLAGVLDPRMVRSSAVSYPEATRKLYAGAFKDFTQSTTSLKVAEKYLRDLVPTW